MNTTSSSLSIWTLVFGSAAAVALGACDRGSNDRAGVAETHAATTTAAQPATPALPPPATAAAANDQAGQGNGMPMMADAGSIQGAAAPNDPASQAGATNLPPFQGQLSMNVSGKPDEKLDYAMKGDKLRLGLGDTPGDNAHGVDAIIDTKSKKATVLLNDRKEYFDVDLQKLADKAQKRAESVRVEKTGTSSVIDGRTCEEWKIIDRDYHVNTCVVHGGPYFDVNALEQQTGMKAPGWLRGVVDAGYMPLRVSITDASGKEIASTQVTDTSHQVEESRFLVPDGFKKTTPSKVVNKASK